MRSERIPNLRHRLPGVVSRLQSAVAELEAMLSELPADGVPHVAPPGEEYPSLAELTARIPYRPQTIRNLIAQGVLRRGVHYLQRRRHGRIVFIWSAMQAWLREHQGAASDPAPFLPAHHARTRQAR